MSLQKHLQVLVLTVALLLPSVGFSSDVSHVVHLFQMDELHQSAPNFTFVDEHGHQLELKGYRGKAILLHFWASWCTPCKKELPDLAGLAKELSSKSWVFIPVSVDESGHREKAIRFLQSLKVKIPFYQVKDPKSVGKYRTWGLPVTYLISPKGEVLARALGRRSWTSKPGAIHDLNTLFSSSK